jgi:hypothetical protein
MIEIPGYQRTQFIHEGTATVVGGSSGVLELSTVLKNSQSIASEIILGKLLRKLIKKVNDFPVNQIIDLMSNG